MKEKKKRRKKWILPRHKFFTELTRFGFTAAAFGIGLKPTLFSEEGDRNYLILLNHQTSLDQFFVGICFKHPVYYVASEDLFSNGFVSSLLRYAVAPIPIKKSMTDLRAVMNCIQVAREGGTIAIAPEGNRTYSGRTGNIKPSIADLAKKLQLPIAFFRIEGGYGIQPRWSDVNRRGQVKAGVSRVMEPEEYNAMTKEELYETICRELFVDEAVSGGPFTHKKSAEYIERALYVCPHCGLSEFESHGDTFFCKHCGLTARYLPNREIEGVGTELPFRFFGQWYDYQENFVRSLDLTPYAETPIYSDTVRFYRSQLYRRKIRLAKQAYLSIYADRITVLMNGETRVFPFEEIRALSVLGRNKLNIYHGDDLYQVKGCKRFCALKYMNLYYHAESTGKEENNGKLQFLGL